MDTRGALLPSKRTALRAFIGSIVLSAVLGIWALLAGGFGELQVKVLLSSLSVSAASLGAMGGAAVLEARGERRLAIPAIVLSGVALVMVLIGIWGELDSEVFWKQALTFCFFAAAFAHLSLLGLARLGSRHLWLQAGMLFLVLGIAGYGAILLWSEASDEAAFRILGVLSILVAAGTLATPVVHRLDAADGAAPDHGRPSHPSPPAALGNASDPVSMLCPACSVNFLNPLGAVQCPKCGACFVIELKNP